MQILVFFYYHGGMKPNELEELRRQLRLLPLSARAIADGSGLKQEWVQKFRRGEIRDPGVCKVCAIRDFVASQKSGGAP